MTCSIINRSTRTTIGRNDQAFDKSKNSGSALQSPDLSRMRLDALMRKQMRISQTPDRSYWAHFMNRTQSANGNATETAAI